MPSRWDQLLDQKPIPLIEHLLDEVAKRVAKDLSGWPLPIREVDETTARQLAQLFAPDARRPPVTVFREAFRLTRWDLQRELEAYDDYVRNRRWLEHGLAQADKPALLFISRWLIEQLLGLAEATEGRINRRRLLDCLDRIERRLS